MTQSNSIQLKNISKSYGNVSALTPTSLSISQGDRVAIIGPSGAGKSTLLNILAGSIYSDSGTYTLGNTEIAHLKPNQRSAAVGIIRQQFDLVGPLKVVHNVLSGHLGRWGFFKSLLSLIHPQSIEDAHMALSKVGIEDKLYERTSNLSGGEQQRVALARLFVQNPKLVLADEPVASLDPARADQIMSLLVELTEQGDQTLIASLHSVELAQKYFSRIIGIKAGRVFIDTPAHLLSHEDIQALYRLEQAHDGAA